MRIIAGAIICILILSLSSPSYGYFYSQGTQPGDAMFYAKVFTNKLVYFAGESVVISGEVNKYDEGRELQIAILNPTKNLVFFEEVEVERDRSFSVTVSDTSKFIEKGEYTLRAQYGKSDVDVTEISFSYDPTTRADAAPPDTTKPDILIPEDIRTQSKVSTRVSYTVEAYDDYDGKIPVSCDYPSDTYFSLGQTIVTCTAEDSAGNIAIATFSVFVGVDELKIPSWIRKVAAFWIADQIDDSGFVQVIQFLVDNNIILIPSAQSSKEIAQAEIPVWVKQNTEFWIDRKISDSDFALGIEWMIKNGIIRV